MFLYAYLRFLLEAIVLWVIIIRITKSDEAELDWWDVALWLFWPYLISMAVVGLGRIADLPEPLSFFVSLVVGFAILAWILKRQYGGEKTTHILVIFVSIRLLFALPRLLPILRRAMEPPS